MRWIHLALPAAILASVVAGCSSSAVNDTSAAGGASDGGSSASSGTVGTGGAPAGGTAGESGGAGGGSPDAGASCLPTGGLLAHFRADDLLLANDAPVNEWPDAVGSHTVQAPSTNEAPKLVTNASDWKGHAIVRFDGVDDRLDGTLPLLELGGGDPSVTFVMVARASDVSVARSAIVWGDSSGATAGLNLIMTPASGWRFGSFGPQESYTPPAPGSQSTLPVLIAATKSGDDYYAYANGEELGFSLNTPGISLLADTLSLGAAVCATSCPEPWQGDLAEVAVYTALSDAVRKQAEACLTETYLLSPE